MADVATATSEGKARKVYAMGDGLYLTVTQRGNKSWCYRQGTTYKALGSWPDLDEVGARAKISGGVVDTDYSLVKWVTNYLNHLIKMKRSPKTIAQYEYALKILQESFKANKIESLKDLDKLKVKPVFIWIKINRTEYAANLAYPFLGAVYTWMSGIGYDIVNPFDGLKKLAILEGEYSTESLRSIERPGEMKDFITKLKEVKNLPIARNCLLAIAYLPLRPMEMSRLKFSDISKWIESTYEGDKIVEIEKGMKLNIPPDRNKTKKDLYWPLTRQMLEIIEYQKSISGGDYVFPNRIGGNGHVKRDALTRVLEQIGYKDKLDVHGLRHTFRTIADEYMNLDRLILEVILGHKIGKSKVEKTYNKSTYMDQKMDVLTKWNNWLDS